MKNFEEETTRFNEQIPPRKRTTSNDLKRPRTVVLIGLYVLCVVRDCEDYKAEKGGKIEEDIKISKIVQRTKGRRTNFDY